MKLVMDLLNQLTPYGTYSYIIMFMILLACGFGLPLPEDIVLITGGILASRGIVDFTYTIVVTMLGVLIGDGIMFSIGYFIGPKIKDSRIFKFVFSRSREAKIASAFKKHGDKVVFFARFAPGLRAPLFLTAGMYKIPFWKFIVLDGFAAIISVPAWVWVGYFFGNNFEILEKKMHQMQVGIYSLVGGLLAIIIAYLFLKKKKKKKKKKNF